MNSRQQERAPVREKSLRKPSPKPHSAPNKKTSPKPPRAKETSVMLASTSKKTNDFSAFSEPNNCEWCNNDDSEPCLLCDRW